MKTKINKPSKTSDKLAKAITGYTSEIVKENTLCKSCKKKK